MYESFGIKLRLKYRDRGGGRDDQLRVKIGPTKSPNQFIAQRRSRSTKFVICQEHKKGVQLRPFAAAIDLRTPFWTILTPFSMFNFGFE